MNQKDLNLEYINYHSLEIAGYYKCPGTISNFKSGASNLFQKRFKNESLNERFYGMTLYFINVYEFDFTDLQNSGRYPKDLPTLKYQAEARFYRGKEQFNVEYLFLEKITIQEMEDFFQEVFNKMNCDFDHHNQ